MTASRRSYGSFPFYHMKETVLFLDKVARSIRVLPNDVAVPRTTLVSKYPNPGLGLRFPAAMLDTFPSLHELEMVGGRERFSSLIFLTF